MRYGLTDGRPRTLQEIKAVYGISVERIRQIEKKAKEKLQQTPVGSNLRSYLR